MRASATTGALPSDGRRKVRVNGNGEAVMVEFVFRYHSAGEIYRLQHTPGSQNTQHRVEVRIICFARDLDGFGQIFAGGRIDFETLQP